MSVKKGSAAICTKPPVTCTATAANVSPSVTAYSYDQAMPGPSGTCPTYQRGPQLYPPLPHPMSMQFNTGLGYISVQSPTQWSAPYWHLTLLPPRLRQSSAFVSAQETSVCVMDAGTNLIKRRNHHMICVCSMRSGVHTCPTTNLPESRFGNAYYHTNPACIFSEWPSFHPQSLFISPDVQNKLQVDHKSFLASLFGIYI